MTRITPVSLSLMTLAGGCGIGVQTEPTANSVARGPARVKLHISAPKVVVAQGEKLPVMLTLTNVSEHPIALDLNPYYGAGFSVSSMYDGTWGQLGVMHGGEPIGRKRLTVLVALKPQESWEKEYVFDRQAYPSDDGEYGVRMCFVNGPSGTQLSSWSNGITVRVVEMEQ